MTASGAAAVERGSTTGICAAAGRWELVGAGGGCCAAADIATDHVSPASRLALTVTPIVRFPFPVT